MRTSWLTTSTLIVALLAPVSAFAFAEGQTGYSGRTTGQSCLSCHGTQQYDGLTFTVNAEEEAPCSTSEGEILLPVITAGATVSVTVSFPSVGDTGPTCPTHNCCDPGDNTDWPPAEDATCLQAFGNNCDTTNANACCSPGMDVCGEALAGFNAEVVGGGGFVAGDGTRLEIAGGEEVPDEITHTAPVAVGNQDASWTFQYTAPSALPPSGLEFWVGGNVANGNGLADGEDLNSNALGYAAVSDGAGGYSMPDYCAVCPNGSLPVMGCCCNGSDAVDPSPRSAYFTFALVALLGFVFTGRRRRS
jgi:hypothetical protein